VTRRTPFPFTAIPVLFVALASACSGAASSDLLARSSGGGSGASGSSGGASNSSGSGGSGSSGGGSGGDTTSQDSGPPLDSGTGFDSGGGDDANVPDTGMMETTAGSKGVQCGSGTKVTYCQNGDICCVVPPTGLFQTTPTYTCQGPNATCSGTPVHCASAADCGHGQVCCGTENVGIISTTYTDVSCQNGCSGTTHVAFCDPAAPVCPQATQRCQMSTVITAYGVCR
jgi:hypothetical protein